MNAIDIENDLRPALQTFAKTANGKIEAASGKIDELAADQARLRATVHDLEQKAVQGFGTGISTTRAEGPGDLVIKAAGLDQLRAGEIKSLRVPVKQFQLGQKAAFLSAGAYGVPGRDSEAYGTLRRPTSVRDLLVVRPTTAGSVDFLRGGVAGTAAIQATEGAPKAELDMLLTADSAGVRTIAAWVGASTQVLSDNAFLADFIESELRDALRLVEDAQLLKGSGLGGNILGLWTQAAAYNRTVAGDTASDTLRRAITQVQLARGVATGIVLSPQGLERIELIKDTGGEYVAELRVTGDNYESTVWRVPVLVSDVLSADEFMVGDFVRAARLWDRQQATIEISADHADFFVRNLVAIRAEERVALTVPRPALLVKGTFAA